MEAAKAPASKPRAQQEARAKAQAKPSAKPRTAAARIPSGKSPAAAQARRAPPKASRPLAQAPKAPPVRSAPPEPHWTQLPPSRFYPHGIPELRPEFLYPLPNERRVQEASAAQ